MVGSCTLHNTKHRPAQDHTYAQNQHRRCHLNFGAVERMKIKHCSLQYHIAHEYLVWQLSMQAEW